MRIATIVRAMLLFAFVLFVWTAVPSPVRANGVCPPGLIEQFVFNERTRQEEIVCGLPPQNVVVNPPVANAPVDPLSPTEPSPWDQASRTIWQVGPDGGTFNSPGEGATATVPPGLLPEGTQLTLVIPPVNGLRPGALKLIGAGGHLINIGMTNPKGFVLLKMNGYVVVCFKVYDWEVDQAGGENNIRFAQWNETDWESPSGKRTTFRPVPPDQMWLFCVELDELPVLE